MNLTKIQEALTAQGIDGWLFFDHHGRDPLAQRILGLDPSLHASRRWYYLIPRAGEPRKLVHRIESKNLDALPGPRTVYSGWQEQIEGLRTIVGGAARVAMQYSPNCAIPYVSLVDAGTIELVRSCGCDVVSSADLVQQFEAAWSEGQLKTHLEAGRWVDAIRGEAFRFIRRKLSAGLPCSEYAVQQFIREAFEQNGLETDHGPICAVNANASNPHYEPTRDASGPIREGDLVLIDMWAKLKQPGSVYYDITWTGVCGPPTEEMKRVFEVVRTARDRAVAFVQSAVSSGRSIQGYRVDDVARGSIRDAGYGEFFVHRTGHSIGQDVHGAGANMDNLETHDERSVISNTCFSIEPGVYLPAFGIRLELNLYINGAEAQVTGEVQQEFVAI